MFVEAQRLGDARLRELGRDLEAMLEEQRTSRFRRAFRDLKIRLLEGARCPPWGGPGAVPALAGGAPGAGRRGSGRVHARRGVGIRRAWADHPST